MGIKNRRESNHEVAEETDVFDVAFATSCLCCCFFFLTFPILLATLGVLKGLQPSSNNTGNNADCLIEKLGDHRGELLCVIGHARSLNSKLGI